MSHKIIPGPVGRMDLFMFQKLPLNGLKEAPTLKTAEGLSQMIIPGPVGRRYLLLFQQLPLNGLAEGFSHMIINHTWACREEVSASVPAAPTQWSCRRV